MTARKKQEERWISAEEAAAILTRNTDHKITQDYVRTLAKKHMITFRAKNGRENEYLASDIETYRVRLRNAPRVRPRPSTRKQEAKEAA